MGQNEQADDERVDADAALAHALHELDVGARLQRRVLGGEAAQQEVDHADEHGDGEQIGRQPEELADDVVVQEGEAGDQPFQQVDDVDQAVEDEAEGHAVVEEGGDLAVANDAPLAEQGQQAGHGPSRQIIERQRPRAAIDDQGHLLEGVVHGRQANRGQQQEHDPFKG